ncbi:MAG: hypothetical protein GX620_16150 [Chloroflexi bacterium]|nr:hypothetical protein [Chloroflexota bacterium]
MQSPLVTTAILPVAGAILVSALFLMPRMRRYAPHLVLPCVALTLILAVLVAMLGRRVVVISLWQPTLLLGSSLVLESRFPLQILILLWTGVTFCTLLFRRDLNAPVVSLRMVPTLGTLAAGLLALWAANPMTLMVAWTAYDLCVLGVWILAGVPARDALRGWMLGGLSTVLVWVGVALSQNASAIGFWDLIVVGKTQSELWRLAAMMRVSLYPFQLHPDSARESGLLAPLLGQRILGWGLWVRLIDVGQGALVLPSWMIVIVAVGLAVSAFLAWSCRSPRHTIVWSSTSLAGAVLLSASLSARLAMPVLLLGAIGVELGTAILSLGKGGNHSGWWRNVALVIGCLSLIGIPPAVGFVTAASLLGGTVAQGQLVEGVAFFLCQVFIVSGLLRWLRWEQGNMHQGRWPALSSNIGLGALALAAVGAGLAPLIGYGEAGIPDLRHWFSLPGISGWLLWAVAVGLGCVLAWQDRNVRPRLVLLLSALYDLLRLEWLYDATAGALGRGIGVLHATDEVIGGAGALLWSALAFLVVALLWRP